jgi:hypothetical protein
MIIFIIKNNSQYNYKKMFSIEFPEINPNEYNHSSYDLVKNIRADTLEITDELVEKLKNYESINFFAYFDNPIDRLPDNIKSIKWKTCLSYSYNINRLPANLESLDISALSSRYNRNKVLKICRIPDTVKELYLPTDKKVLIKNIPKSIEILYLNSQELSFELQSDLMNCTNLKRISIGSNEGYQIHNFKLYMLPDNLEFLEIISNISSNLDNLPNKIKEIKLFMNIINFSLDNLPYSLERLQIIICSVDVFKIPLDFLPINLKELEIKTTIMDITLTNLPENLEILILTFEENINSNENWLVYPKGLKHLELHVLRLYYNPLIIQNLKKISDGLPEELPEGLVELEIDILHLSTNIKLPSSLKYLKIKNTSRNYTILSDELELLQELRYLNLDSNITLKLKEFPKNLECLIISDVLEELPKFPESLKTLFIHNYQIDKPILSLPENLEHFFFNSTTTNINLITSNTKLIPELPANLKSLFLECVFNNPIVLPPNLIALGIFPRSIERDNKVNEIVQNIFFNMPDSIEIFSTSVFVQLYKFDRLPNNLKELGIKNVKLNKLDFNKFFTNQGCKFNSSNIKILTLNDHEDIDTFNNYIMDYFDKYNFEYQLI